MCSLEIAADIEVAAAEVIAAGVEILLGAWIGGAVGAMFLGMRTTGQHAGNGAAEQHPASDTHCGLRRTGEEASATLPAPIIVFLPAIPGPPARRAALGLWLIATKEAAKEATRGSLTGFELLDALLRLPQRLFLDQDGLGHVVGRGRKFPKPLLDERFGVAVARLAVARDVLDAVEQPVNGLLVLLVRHVPTP